MAKTQRVKRSRSKRRISRKRTRRTRKVKKSKRKSSRKYSRKVRKSKRTRNIKGGSNNSESSDDELGLQRAFSTPQGGRNIIRNIIPTSSYSSNLSVGGTSAAAGGGIRKSQKGEKCPPSCDDGLRCIANQPGDTIHPRPWRVNRSSLSGLQEGTCVDDVLPTLDELETDVYTQPRLPVRRQRQRPAAIAAERAARIERTRMRAEFEDMAARRSFDTARRAGGTDEAAVEFVNTAAAARRGRGPARGGGRARTTASTVAARSGRQARATINDYMGRFNEARAMTAGDVDDRADGMLLEQAALVPVIMTSARSGRQALDTIVDYMTRYNEARASLYGDHNHLAAELLFEQAAAAAAAMGHGDESYKFSQLQLATAELAAAQIDVYNMHAELAAAQAAYDEMDRVQAAAENARDSALDDFARWRRDRIQAVTSVADNVREDRDVLTDSGGGTPLSSRGLTVDYASNEDDENN